MSEIFWANDFVSKKNKILSFLKKQGGSEMNLESGLPKQLLIASEGEIEIFYSPFDLVQNKKRKTKILIVGITPGQQQASLALKSFFANNNGNSLAFSNSIRETAAFAGSLRSNMVKMLDDLELPTYLDIESSSELFKESADLMTATSLLKFPVFFRGENYRGGTPEIHQVPILASMVDYFFLPELSNENEDALIIPLGVCVQRELKRRANSDCHIADRVLWGFPHPSGQNGHRVKAYRENYISMKKIIKNFFP